MKRKEISRVIAQKTGDLIGSLADYLLFVSYGFLMLPTVRTMGDTERLLRETEHFLDKVNHTTITRSFYGLMKRGLIRKNRTKIHQELEITEAGKQRLQELFPTYKEKRPWDGYLYLISYDIPIKSNMKRNLLRTYLRRIGCGKLQDSLWMTPYNPMGIIDEFIDEHHIPGTILVSKLGKDGNIGQKDRKTLISQVYQYDTLIDRYNEFLKTYQKNQNPNKTQLSMDYYTILNDDPQLPFPLEPDDFPTRMANALFRRLLVS